jgi:predicted O-methyltransferase YrrM
MVEPIKLNVPPGHYFSPVVDPSEAGGYHKKRLNDGLPDLRGIEINSDDMRAFWERNLSFIQSCPFGTGVDERTSRYYFGNRVYDYGDATILRAMIHDRKPRRIIEIGSGFSTACTLDVVEELGLQASLTCIEPNAGRVKRLLRPADIRRVQIIEKPVQEIPLDVFRVLERNDILFIDSTHVLKTGSDVHYELFYILPSLNPGVVVHFHDIHFPFEYPWEWVHERNRSWNEVYAVRAFLTYNDRFRIVFFNSYFGIFHRCLIQKTYPPFLKNKGGALWLTRTDAPM